MKNFGRIIKCGAAAVICTFALSGCKNYNKMMDETPQEYINLAADNTATAMLNASFKEEAAIIEKALEECTMGFSFDYEDIKFSSDIYVNEADKKTSGTYNIDADGEKIELYYAVDEDTIKFGEAGASGKNTVEVDIKTLAKDFKNSIFAPGSGSYMELSQEEFDMIVEILDEVSEAMSGDGKDLPENYAEIEKLITEMLSDASVEKNTKVEIDGTEVKANVLTYNFDKKDIKKIVDACVDIVKDEMAAQGEVVSQEDIDEAINEVMDPIDKFDVEMVYYVNSKTHCLMQMELTADMTLTIGGEAGDIKAEAVITYGADPEKSEETTIEIEAEAKGEKVSASIVSERKSKNETEVTIKAGAMGVSMEIATLNFERDGEDYTISAEVPLAEAKATIEGTIKTDKKSVEATVEKISCSIPSEYIDVNLKDFDLKFYIKQGGKFDDRDAKNLFKLSEEEIMTFVENVGSDLEFIGIY